MARRLGGGSQPYGPRRQVPAIVWWLIGAVVVIHLGLWILPYPAQEAVVSALAVSPARLMNTDMTDPFAVLQALSTFLTHTFVHAGWGHLGMNVLALFIFGTLAAARFNARTLMGSFIFLSFYFSGAVFSSFMYVVTSLGQDVALVGASGAISTLMGGGARFAFQPVNPITLRRPALLPITDRRVIAISIVYIILNLLILTPLGGAAFLTEDPGSIAWEVHIAGYVYGVLLMPWFDRLAGNGPVRRL